MAALKAAKKELRQRIKSSLALVSQEAVVAQSRNAVLALQSMAEFTAARRIAVYLSMPQGEIDTKSIVHYSLSNGKYVFVPYIYKRSAQPNGEPKSVMDMLELQSIGDYDSLKRDAWGIPSLPQESVAARHNCLGGKGVSDGTIRAFEKDHGLDLIVMPGSAFDSNLGRLGHGKGFYDFFLQRYHEGGNGKLEKMPFLVGLSLNEQLLPKDQTVPRDASDWMLDALITGDGNILRREKYSIQS
ncbi:MAG: hypothetical protein M1820_004548 [Bogoriella megaspora]|nr:MAG: hypothetical protein M1820_004548 [Bogoriella megaspora]